MPLSDAGQRDPSMLGTSGYARNALDFYPTPKRAIDSLLSVIGDDLPSYSVWEPFCGNGAISKVIADDARAIVSTDINAYEGFDADGLVDFFKIDPSFFEDECADTQNYVSLTDITKLKGFTPDCIITNPPYGKEAEQAARHALALMEEAQGNVYFLCRHEWDTSKRRADLFDHPAFASKIVLRHRPRWIEGSEGAPRFSYAWYHWSWAKANQLPFSKAEIFYAP